MLAMLWGNGAVANTNMIQLDLTDGRSLLVGGLEHVLFSHSVGNVIIPTDFHIFQRGRSG